MLWSSMLFADERTIQATPSVLVLPLDELVGPAPQPWIGHAVQQNFIAELARQRLVNPLDSAPAPKPGVAMSSELASELARELSAEYAVFGSYLIVENQIRLTARMISSADGSSVSSLKSTGAVRDLFALQDDLSEQLRRDVARKLSPNSREAIVDPAVTEIAFFGPVRVDYFQTDRSNDLAESLRYTGQYDARRYRDRYYFSSPAYGNFGYSGYGYRSSSYFYGNPYPGHRHYRGGVYGGFYGSVGVGGMSGGLPSVGPIYGPNTPGPMPGTVRGR